MDNFTIRPIRAEDAGELARLDIECFSVPWSETAFKDEAENAIATYFLACDSEKIIGYIGYWNVMNEGNITNIAVLPEYRRKKVASLLLEHSVKTAISGKLDLLTLEVRKSNIPARSLYEKYGFKEIGVRKNYYHKPTEDAIIMTLNLK
ncbi:MAG: ribosomal protein S18-alanine N-acetyltransferase [Clostridia bacterium]|nr:ribosomal protein S18-alanine N-acetyltransferase [Clostridia bacterium]